MSQSCGQCQWWLKTGTDVGECRAEPPRLVDPLFPEHAANARWPRTDPEDWGCRLFKLTWTGYGVDPLTGPRKRPRDRGAAKRLLAQPVVPRRTRTTPNAPGATGAVGPGGHDG